MKFYDYILNGFKVIDRTYFVTELLLTKFKGTNSISINTRVMVLVHYHLMLVNICMKFHEDILNGFKVIERT